MVFYLKNLVWREFTRQVGFPSSLFKGRYDFALSFAGADRDVAKRLADILSDREVVVFYDEDEQHRIIAQDVDEYLGPIYRRDADYVVALLSPAYPTRIWKRFESDASRSRFGNNSVISIRFLTANSGWFSDEAAYGGLSFDPGGDRETQLQAIAETLSRRLIVDRSEEDKAATAGFDTDESTSA